MKISNKQIIKVIFLISLFLFVYTVIRAYALSITWDEAFSFNEYIRNNVAIEKGFNNMSANNHILNTWLAIQFVKLFGESEFVLRLPSLLAHLLFLFFSARLVLSFENKKVSVIAFCIVNFNPYLLDFFSLSRGYGLSMGLMMASIYYLYCFIVLNSKTKYALLAIFLAGLATLAHFVLLYYLCVLFGVIMSLNGFYSLSAKESFIKKIIDFFAKSILTLILFLIFFCIVVQISFQLKVAGALFYGGKTSFWQDTIGTIVERCFYGLNYNYWFQRFAKGILFVVLFLTSAYLYYSFYKKTFTRNKLFIATLFFMIIGIALASIIQKNFLDSYYLLERTALCFVVLFNLLFVFLLNEFSKQYSIAKGFISFFGIALLIHFFFAFNFKYVLEWNTEAEVKSMLADLNRIKVIPKEKNNISIAIPLDFSTDIEYYRNKYKYYWINDADEFPVESMLYDYFYLKPQQFEKMDWSKIEIVREYPITKTILAKRKIEPRIKVCKYDNIIFPELKNDFFVIDSTVLYSKGFEYRINDSITPLTNGVISIKATVSASDFNQYKTTLIVSFENEKGSYYWKPIAVKDFIQERNKLTNIYFTCIIPTEVKNGDRFKTYIWNPEKNLLYLKEIEYKWLEYKF